MDIYIAPGGKKEGPYTLFRIREMLLAGDIDRRTLGWMQGVDGWKPLEEIDYVLVEIQKLDQEKLDTETPPMQRVEHIQPGVGTRTIISHAFCRFGARMLDIFIFQVVVWTIVGRPEIPEVRGFWEMMQEGPTAEETAYSYRILMVEMGAFFLWHLVEAVLISVFGTTPGKYFFNIRVRDKDGNPLQLLPSLWRSLQVWLLGVGIGFPVAQYIMQLIGLRRLQTKGITWWDENLQIKVEQGNLTRNRVLGVFVVFLILIMIHSYLT